MTPRQAKQSRARSRKQRDEIRDISEVKMQNGRQRQKLLVRERLEKERAKFDVNASRPYRIVNTTFLSLKVRPFKKDFMQSFMVLLDKPLRKNEVEKRMEGAFGDLEC